MTDVQELRAKNTAESFVLRACYSTVMDKVTHVSVPSVVTFHSAVAAVNATLLDAPEALAASEARVVKLREALADMIPGPLCGDSFVPPIPDTKFLSLDGMTWGKLRRARQALKEVGDVE